MPSRMRLCRGRALIAGAHVPPLFARSHERLLAWTYGWPQVAHVPLLASNHLDAMEAYTRFVTGPERVKAYRANVPRAMSGDSAAAANSASAMDGMASCYCAPSSLAHAHARTHTWRR